jgi:hypothetical protein
MAKSIDPSRPDPTSNEVGRTLRQRERERLAEARRMPEQIATKVINPDGTFVSTDVVVLLQAISDDLKRMRDVVEQIPGIRFSVTSE